MATKIFVNLPVRNLNKSVDFFTQLGFSVNKQFTDETAACIVISEDIYAMLLTHEKFKQFTKKEIVDSTRNTEVILALSAESREQVSELVTKAVDAGGKESADPADYGFMYQRSFQDLDGHLWEVVWMNPEHVQPS